tara:strand:+ start:66 stop:1373 length:1308 start_codon:yes stop_codon:yes gene_type:complete
MADESDNGSFESRLGKALDTIDEASRKLEKSIKERLDRKTDSKDSVSGEEEVSESSNSESLIVRTRGGVGKIGSKVSTSVENANIREKASGLGNWMGRVGQSVGSGLNSVGSHLPYIIPATVIFQTALWLAYLSDGSVSHDLVSSKVDGLGEAGQDVAILISIFGAFGAKMISLDFDANHAFDTFSLNATVVDVMVVFLTLSAILYMMKKFQSLYYLSLVFIGSFVLRIGGVEQYSYDWVVVVCSAVGLMGLFFAVSLPLYRDRANQNKKDSEIDTSLLIDSVSDKAESSYLEARVDGFDSHMDQAPVTKPRRPSRRSEYELYEWVLLLANLILWPGVVIISIILGSGTEVNGSTYNLDDNYLMLLGPLLLTLFFFTLLYKMDANARDGSLYAAEKQSYLDEMTKYLEARTSYLELVTLQAEMKKQQIVGESSEE